jgi:hypothetical protein
MKHQLFGFALAAIVSWAAPAHATQEIVGRVTSLESSYMPGGFIFRMNTGNTACPVGSPLQWNGGFKQNPDNVGITYSTVLNALLWGKKVKFYINDNDVSCLGQFLQVLQ